MLDHCQTTVEPRLTTERARGVSAKNAIQLAVDADRRELSHLNVIQ